MYDTINQATWYAMLPGISAETPHTPTRQSCRDIPSSITPLLGSKDAPHNLYMLCLLHLTNNLLGPSQTLNHLLALLPPANGVLALLEQIVEFLCPIHLFEKFALHFFFTVPVDQNSQCPVSHGKFQSLVMQDLLNQSQHDSLGHHIDHRPPHNAVVRRDQQLDHLHLLRLLL